MFRPRPRRSSSRIVRLCSVTVVAAFVLTALLPLADAAWRHDDRCCSNGICCCKPKTASTDCCVRSACPCGGHDEHDANVPVTRPFELAAPFSLARTRDLRGATLFSRAPGTEDGFLPLLDHPPDSLLTAAC